MSSSADSRPGRYRSLVFWVYEPLESLSDRLDARVDKMVTQGLLDEIKALRAEARRIYGSEDNADCEEGIFQAIGGWCCGSLCRMP